MREILQDREMAVASYHVLSGTQLIYKCELFVFVEKVTSSQRMVFISKDKIMIIFWGQLLRYVQ